ncbi:DUF438 domain-containing protein [Salisediminibacterium selenitireducens]|uniref:Hemerythrin HHE cation binding domain protein n=1 Tax=Bacillus selenitireducens (strain ATCC 700615 / DSM 15326 / MLS10) TaxID=439292 RepID=D6XYM2_BACIE|nr:DUF438 domain-containing protein [Salisediminibacterium selenitireducens]ADH98180.1 Hemerythrin HHE cation binding domain protein [[Bacillus] selenitireducens MLS10]
MSEVLNNREVMTAERTDKQEKLKQIIKKLHDGASVEDVKQEFEDTVGSISVAEISQMEHALMEEENIPVKEVQRLCSVHTEVFKGSIDQIHGADGESFEPGHPVHTFMLENRELEHRTGFSLSLHKDRFVSEPNEENRSRLLADLTELLQVDVHYSRKENLVFPYMEKYGIYGPTTVMWGVQDTIREAIKETRALLMEEAIPPVDVISEKVSFIIDEITEMIFKEENILFPMAMQHLTEDEWLKIEREGNVIGYMFIEEPKAWKPERADLGSGEDFLKDGTIQLETGILNIEQLELMMNHLPLDITYIDEHDIVRYYSHGKDPIFARTKTVIGRSVQNCHPPKSAHLVEDLLDAFKSGAKDTEDFWIPFRGRYIHIRYFAVRDEDCAYRGTLEMKQDIAPIQKIEGEKRLMSE